MTHAALLASIEAHAAQMRYDIIEMIAEAGSGHPGGSLSAADIVATLYWGVMRHNPADPAWSGRYPGEMARGK